MIYGVTGKLGGGKSLSCVRWMLEQLRCGMPVVSNIALIREPSCRYTGLSAVEFDTLFHLVDFDGEEADPWKLPTGDFRGHGDLRALIVVDEAGEWFSGMSRKAEAEWASWLRQSDKRGQDVALIVQDASILARSGRCLVHRWMSCTDYGKAKIPLLGGMALPPFIRNAISVKTYDSGGRNVIGTDRFMKSPEIWNCYDTAAMFGESAIASLQARTINKGEQIDVLFSKNHFQNCSSYFVWIVIVGLLGSLLVGGIRGNLVLDMIGTRDYNVFTR